MKTKAILLQVLMCLSALPLHATTVKWLIQPDYDTICYYSKDLFKCKKNGKYQLINLAGKKLAEADSITDFYNGYALFLDFLYDDHCQKTDDGFLSMKIIGFMSEEDHVFKEVKEDLRTTYYSFFSEETLVVANAKGELGYLDSNNELIIDCQYWKALPFCQGWASVIKKKSYLFGLIQKETPKYIDKHNNTLTVYFNDGRLRDASSFNENGKAIVGYDKNNKMAVINTKGVVETEGIPFNRNLFRLRDYAYNENNDTNNFVVPRNNTPDFSEDIFVFWTDGLGGYRTQEDTLLYPQFTHAGKVADGCAIVALDGRYGIITFVYGSFSSSIDKSAISFKGNETPELNYLLYIPESLVNKPFELDFDNGEGQLTPVNPDDLQPTGTREYTYRFIPQVKKTDKFCMIKIQVRAEGLLLWQDTKKISVQNSASQNVKFFFNNPGKANTDDLLTFSVKVSNNTNEPVVRLEFDVPEHLKNDKESDNEFISETQFNVRIEPGKSKTINVTFKVSKQEEFGMPIKAIGENGKVMPVSKPKKIKLVPNDA